MALVFSRDPVWSQTTKSGFRQQVFVMYHATLAQHVTSIINNGFRNSQGSVNSHGGNLVLGDGLYVSKDKNKAEPYGEVCFKLLVYPGKAFGVYDGNDPEKTTWNKNYSSAWVPPNATNWHSDKEETCVKSTHQVRILGMSKGWERLRPEEKQRLRNLEGTGDTLDPLEIREMDRMLEQLGIMYCHLACLETGGVLMLEERPSCSASGGEVGVGEWSGRDNQLWTRTWDNCLENKASGNVMCAEGNSVVMEGVDAEGDRNQKWKLDNGNRLLHKASNRVMTVVEDGVELRKFYSDADTWKFTCMDNSRAKDDFVEYTPWQDMITWG